MRGRKRPWSWVLLTVVMYFVSASPAWASSSASTVSVADDEMVETPARTEQYASRIAGSVTVITQADILNSTAMTVGQLLTGEAGVAALDAYANGSTALISMRGFAGGGHTLVLVDGRRVSALSMGGIGAGALPLESEEWPLIPLEAVERIEVSRGDGGVFYGDGATAGVINIITKKGEDTDTTPSVDLGVWIDSLSFEDFDGHMENLSVRGAYGALGYYVFGKYRDTNGSRENSDLAAEDLIGRFSIDFSDTLYADLRGSYHADDQELPGGLTEDEMEEDRAASSTSGDDAEYERTALGAAAGYSLEGVALIELGYNLSENALEADVESIEAEVERDTKRDDLSLKGALTLGNNRLMGGVERIQGEADSAWSYDADSSEAESFVSREELGYYLADEYTVTEGLVLSAGYRLAEADYLGEAEGGQDEEMSFEEYALRAGIVFNYSTGSKLYASYSDGFRLPSTDELFASDGSIAVLEAERSSTFEAGILHAFGSSLEAGAAYYYADLEDEIYQSPVTFDALNLESTLRQGLEVHGRADLSDSLILKGSYAYTRATLESGEYEGNAIPLVPKNKASLGLSYAYDISRISLSANWVDERYLDGDWENDYDPLEDYITLDLRITFMDENGEIFMGVDNLLDEEYEEYGAVDPEGNIYYPASEQRFYLGLKMTL